MSERSSAWIQIGGRIPRSKVHQLIEEITKSGVATDWGDATYEPKSVDELLEALKEGRLWLCDDQARYGEFPELEKICRRVKLAYTRCSDGGVVYDASRVDWRPGMKKPLARRCSTESEGCILVPQEAVEKVLVALDKTHIRQARRLLRAICTQVPSVPAFEIV